MSATSIKPGEHLPGYTPGILVAPDAPECGTWLVYERAKKWLGTQPGFSSGVQGPPTPFAMAVSDGQNVVNTSSDKFLQSIPGYTPNIFSLREGLNPNARSILAEQPGFSPTLHGAPTPFAASMIDWIDRCDRINKLHDIYRLKGFR